METEKKIEVGLFFKSLSIAFLIGNVFTALAYGVGLYLGLSEGESFPAFEYIRVQLYCIDIVAFYFLFLGRIGYLKVIFATSSVYTLGAWYYGAVVNDIFAASGTYNFYMFVLTATVLPFIDLALLYIVGKKHINKSSKLDATGGATS